MIKKTFSVLALASALFMASCSSEPSDLRPETKVSVDYVPPGHRNNTSNIDKADDREGQDNVFINHEEHTNEIGREKEGIPASQQTNEAKNIENH
ncbi:hypothetical protein [Rufibacter roseus]|uniref:Lipoprotein n=1 Tax=Rufibacter roseus TaxID=1567108 RepID=A0ABW2DIQ5_9BACT|nr:hypothetical protein [Rufibacter roseus]